MEPIEDICTELINTFETGVEDPVSLVTLIELQIDQVIVEKSVTERHQFLFTLLSQLELYPEVVEKISWDLPKQLIRFITPDNVRLHRNLRDSPIFPYVAKCFNMISLHSNPRDSLISGCEILTNISYEKEEANDSEGEETDSADLEYLEARVAGDFYVSLKMYLIFEMLGACMKRINTLQPSKYLSTVVAAIEKFTISNSSQMNDPNLIPRRVFTFCKGYAPPAYSMDNGKYGKLSKKEITEIKQSEIALQGKLMRQLCTTIVGEAFKTLTNRSEIAYFCRSARLKIPPAPFYEPVFDVQSRFFNLALSYDIDIEGEFRKCVQESRRIYRALPNDEDIPNDEAKGLISRAIFKMSYTYQLQKLKNNKEVQMNEAGLVFFASFNYLENHGHIYKDISLEDAMYLYLRFTTPSFYSNLYDNSVVEGACKYFIWVALNHTEYRKLREEMSKVPSFVLRCFLQCLILKACSQASEETRMVSFTLLTRLLCIISEDISYQFLVNVLRSFPYPHGKSAVLIILKDLILKKCPYKSDDDIDSLSKDFSKLKIKNKELETDPKFYITLTQARMKQIHDIAISTIKSVSKEETDHSKVTLVSHYLNFFISVNEVWDESLLDAIDDELLHFPDDKIEKEVENFKKLKTNLEKVQLKEQK